MAARKRRSTKRRRTTRRASKCKIVSVNGRRRRICWGRKGITSNRPAGGARKRRRRRSR